MKIEIDPKILNLDDERITALRLGKITPFEFWRLSTPQDPWIVVGNKLIFIPEEQHKIQISSFYNSQLQYIKQTGQLSPSIIYKNKEVFLEIYPELKDSFDKVPKNILDNPSCPGCTINKECKFLLDNLLKIKYDGRDLSKLESLVDNKTKKPIISKYGIMKLKGIDFSIDKNEIQLPMQVNKKYPPILDETKMKEIQKESFEFNYNLNRPSCIDCFKKHIIHSCILLREILGGYTKEKGHIHQDQVECELQHAVEESVKDFNDKSIKVQQLLDEYKLIHNHKQLLNNLINILENEFNLSQDLIYTIGLMIELEDRLLISNLELSEQIKNYRKKLQGQTEVKDLS